MDSIPKSAGDFLQDFEKLIDRKYNRGDREIADIYTRLSKYDPQDPGYSLEIQAYRAKNLVEQQGWDIHQIIEDPDQSGGNSNRPGFKKLMADIKAERITVVVIHRLDRLYRNLEALLGFLRICQAHRVRLVSVSESFDSDSWWGRLLMYVLGAFAEIYLRQASERTREAKRRRVKTGLSNASYCFGYCNGLCSACTDPNGQGYCPLFGNANRPESKNGSILVPHPIERYAVVEIVTMYNQGYSDLEIADRLNRNRFTLSDGQSVQYRKKGHPGKTKPGEFSRDNIRDIINNPFMVGLIAEYPTRKLNLADDPEHPEKKLAREPLRNKRMPKALTEGKHEPLYSRELYFSNKMLRESKRTSPTRTDKPVRDYLLSGVGYCWVCYTHKGQRVKLRGSKGSDGRPYYRCATMQEKVSPKHLQLDDPKNEWEVLIKSHRRATLNANVMEDHINKIMREFTITPEFISWIMAYYDHDDGKEHIERQQYNLSRELEHLKELFSAGVIDNSEFKQRLENLKREFFSINPENPERAENSHPKIDDFGGLWGQMTLPEKKGLLRTIFNALFFDENGDLCYVEAKAPFDQMIILPPGIMLQE